MKILILSCSTGEGHNSAAKAIAETLIAANIQCEIIDPLVFQSKKTQHKVASAYNNLICKAPSAFGFIYKLGAFYESLRLPSPVYWANKQYAETLGIYIKEGAYDCVICTHLFAMQSMTAARKTYGLNVPCYGVLTDYTTIPFYSETDLDGYFVPNETVKAQLAKKRIATEKIHCTGIPVSEKFRAPMERETAKDRLSIPPQKKVVMILSGGAGCGKIAPLCRAMARTLDENHIVYVFHGKNEKLRKKLDCVAEDGANIVPIAFTSEINIYMKAADVVLSKPGGLSSTEIAVSGTPFVLLKAIPGCETYNRKYFVANGLALPAKTITQAVGATVKLLTDARARDAMCARQQTVICAQASDLIVQKIIEGLT